MTQEENKEPEKSAKPCEADTSEDEVLAVHAHDDNTSDVFNTSVRQRIELSESLPNSPASFSQLVHFESVSNLFTRRN
jgi:hypothetical protein